MQSASWDRVLLPAQGGEGLGRTCVMSRNLVPGALGCVYLGSTQDVELHCYGMQLQAAESRACLGSLRQNATWSKT